MGVQRSAEIPLDEAKIATVPRSAELLEALKRFRASIEGVLDDHAREINKVGGDENIRRNVAG